MAKAVRIILEEDGYPRELLSPADWRRALADGSLEEATEVTVYRDGAAPEYSKARDVAELQPLFRPAPLPREERPPPPPAPRPEPAAAAPLPFIPPGPAPAPLPADDAGEIAAEWRPSPWSVAGDPLPGDEHELYDDDEDYHDAPAWEPAPEPERRSHAPLLLVLAAVAALFVIVWIANGGAPAAQAPATAYRVTGTANVRTLPSAEGSEVVDQLRRDERIVGVPRSSGGETWVEISEGVNAGRYVWGRNLAAATP